MQSALSDLRLELVPEGNDQILRRRDDPLKEFHVEVEVAVIAKIDDFPLNNGLQLSQVDHVTC